MTAPPTLPRRTEISPSVSRIRMASRMEGLDTGNSSSRSSTLGSTSPSASSPSRIRRRRESAIISAMRGWLSRRGRSMPATPPDLNENAGVTMNKIIRRPSLISIFVTLRSTSTRGGPLMYDLVIRGGTVVDGTGSPRFRADVAVAAGRVATVGAVPERGQEEIDASGLLVTPGFIDGHTHFDAQIFWDPLGNCASLHGVTTCVMGNCGFTLAPTPAATQDLAMRSIERAEDISRQDMLTGVPWTWNTYADYLDAVDALPKGINYAGYIGHSALRDFVMGERAFTETATVEDMTAMRAEVADALRAGAIGFSTSRIAQHRTVDDGPVASYVASWDEVAALAGTLGQLGAGNFQVSVDITDPEIRHELRRIALGLGAE